jgi:DNA/RNA-binding domain of Phe-tRNA-synthetase-like protein
MRLDVSSDLASIVRPAWWLTEGVRVVERDARLDEPLEHARASLLSRPEPVEMIAAVRAMYKQLGIDPTKTRPSSEALLRRVRRGDALPRVNSFVDVINWCSVETQLPYGLYDAAKIDGDVTLRRGRAGEQYAGIRKDAVHVDGRLTLADALGPFGNPTSDSARTMVTTATTRGLVVIYAPAGVSPAIAERAASLTRERIAAFCT